MSWEIALLTFGSNLIVAIIAAYLTASFAFRRFYREKWWERRYDAYETLFEGLHHIRQYAAENLAQHTRGRSLPDDAESALLEKRREGIDQVRRIHNFGAFIVAPGAVEAIAQFFQGLEASVTGSWEQNITMTIKAADECIERVRLIAQDDLSGGPQTLSLRFWRG